MRNFYYIFIILFINNHLIAQESTYGKARIIERNYFYEYNDLFMPYDFFTTNECNNNPLRIDLKTPNQLIIENHFGNCYTGVSIKFYIDSSLNITNIKYHSSSDVIISGVKEIEEVENIILYFNKNPFKDTTGLIGKYHALIKIETIVDSSLQLQFGHRAGISFNTESGKFRIYSPEEKKLNKAWIRKEMERSLGILDTNNIIDIPEVDPQFCYGSDSLIVYLQNVVFDFINPKNIKNNEIAFFEFIIDRTGKIEKISVDTKSGIPPELKEKIETKILETSCWIPAINYGMTVKSTIYPWIKLKE